VRRGVPHGRRDPIGERDVDLVTATSTIDLAKDTDQLVSVVQGLADESAIRNLAALYAMAVDDHDIERVLDCFADDGTFTRAGNTTRGKTDLRAFFITMMDRYVTTLHTPHTHVISASSGDTAEGLTTGHAELSLKGTLMMAAYRYSDVYSRVNTRWVFQSRALKFMYVLPFQDMASSFFDTSRIRWPELPYADADFPETSTTWTSYR
jgi:uncharacterized protein (TIGR02246 family)